MLKVAQKLLSTIYLCLEATAEFCFPETLNASRCKAEGNIEVEEVEVAPLPMIFHQKMYPVLIIINNKYYSISDTQEE